MTLATASQTQAPQSEFLTAGEAGQWLGTGERFVRRLIAERRITFHKIGAKVRIREEDLRKFAEAGRVESER